MLFRARARCAPLLAAVLVGAALPAVGAEPAPSPAPSPSPTAGPAASATPAPTLTWRSLGPAVAGGRVATVAGTDRAPALFYAGAADGGKDVARKHRDEEAGDDGNDDDARLVGRGSRSLEEDREPLDCHAEGDDEEAGDDADEDGEEEEETLFAGR